MKPTYMSHHAEEMLMPRWKRIARYLWGRLWPYLALLFIFAIYLLVSHWDSKELAMRHAGHLLRSADRSAACELMNSLPKHIWIIEARDPVEGQEKLRDLAAYADAARFTLMQEARK